MIQLSINSNNIGYKNFIPYVISFLAGFFYAFEMLQMSLGSTLSIELIRNYGFSIYQLQLFSSIYLYSCALAIIPAGILFDRYPAKPLLIFSLILCLSGLLITAFANTPFFLITGRALIGLSSDFSFLGYFVLINYYFKGKNQVLMNSLIYSWGAAGCLISQAPFSLLLNAVGMRVALLILFAIGMFLLAGLLYFIENFKIQCKKTSSQFPITLSIKQVLFNKTNMLCAFYSSISNLPLMILGALYGKIYLINVLNVTSVQASNLNSIIFIGALIGSPIVGYFAARLKIPNLMLTFGVLGALCWASLTLWGSNIWFVSFTFFTFGILINAQLLSVIVIINTNFKRLMATSLSVLSITNNASGGLYQLLFSFLLLYYAPINCLCEACNYSIYAFNHIFLLVAGLYLISSFTIYFLMSNITRARDNSSPLDEL